ncbi:Na+/H+ antiporter NhaC family protein [Marinobacterium jannaschii]|uniref:Na+/H+ antiporter NhaC family protein n=1 Tax=Marinobacterium jannaschii TaxID=64970 RepID=UPI00055F0FAD|nr:Na+/H+ antiporter NhaC family protein [Marinobacterium jannaschii]
MKSSPLALLPLAMFLAMFIGSGLYYQSQAVEFAFYQISAPVAILPAIALAVLLGKDSLNSRIDTLMKGIGDQTIITMVVIYLLAGGFASVAKAIGGVDATVNLGLSLVPAWMILPGLFIISAFIATSMGTSMGTIAAVAPIAVGVSEATQIDLALAIGTVVGGAMFGDNLSIISDTTIAATRTQGCEMRDKFRQNFRIAMPAAIATVALLFLQGESGVVAAPGEIDMLLVMPYLAVLVLALSGLNVMVVLFSGIVLAGITGLLQLPDYSVAQLSKDIYAGYSGMQEILILSLLIGGLGALMKSQGGLEFIARQIDKLTSRKQTEPSPRAGELSISAAVALTNVCTANNTVAIIISGGLARDIACRYGVDPKRSASLMDIFSCVVQGMLPYGAQVLLAGSIAALSPLEIVGSIYYCLLLGVAALFSIAISKPALSRVQPEAL